MKITQNVEKVVENVEKKTKRKRKVEGEIIVTIKFNTQVREYVWYKGGVV